MACGAVWEEVVWKLGREKEVQRGSAGLVSAVSRHSRGPFGICRPDLPSCEPQNCMSCVKCVSMPGLSSIEFVSLKETCKEIYQNTRFFSLLFGLFLVLILKGTIVV